MKINAQHHKLLLLILTGVLVFWFGRLSIQYEISKTVPPVQIVTEVNQKIPMIEIIDIQNAKIVGSVNKSEIRIRSGESVAVPNDEYQFELDIQHLGYIGDKRPVVVHQVPEWAQFVASKSGKYFYELDEKSAKNLSVENRVYFATQEEAVKAGFARRSR
jgi:hypothetical protein